MNLELSKSTRIPTGTMRCNYNTLPVIVYNTRSNDEETRGVFLRDAQTLLQYTLKRRILNYNNYKSSHLFSNFKFQMHSFFISRSCSCSQSFGLISVWYVY